VEEMSARSLHSKKKLGIRRAIGVCRCCGKKLSKSEKMISRLVGSALKRRPCNRAGDNRGTAIEWYDTISSKVLIKRIA
jgi:hypothetical protein